MSSRPTCTEPGCTGPTADGRCTVCGAAGAAGTRPAPDVHTESHTRSMGPLPRGSAPALPPPGPSGALGSARVRAGAVSRRSSTRTGSQRLGAGITTIPAVAVADPRSVVLGHPQVPENRRFCGVCGAKVGRTHDGIAGRAAGFCAQCRTPFSFEPKLRAGDLVGGQYEVAGALAHGGLGWIYLAQDRNLSDRWVVLKGLLNTDDRDAYAAAVAERQFLAEVQHPLIVSIHNFAEHEGAGYIVMEYVGGRSLKQILQLRTVANGGRYDPLPADQAVGYVVEILPAFSYLHAQGLLYCDFKPDNIIQTGNAITLIDLGGVRRSKDTESAIYGTIGYQAPEVPTDGPSVASDIYTIGRTLTMLALEFAGYRSTYVDCLPPMDTTPLFQRYDSLYRVLRKSTASHPHDRFQSVDELRDQLLAVLREIVAADRGTGPAQSSTPSQLFGAPSAAGADLSWTELPTLLVDDSDPAAAWLKGVSIDDPARRLAALDAAPQDSMEVRLARARTAIDGGLFAAAGPLIEQILDADPWEWRAVWLRGLSRLAQRPPDPSGAAAAFDAVLDQVPGELAPKLALALASERAGADARAARLYRTCTTVDANYVAPAAFGLARTALAAGDLDGALAALDLVAPTSASFVAARRTRAEVLAASGLGLRALADAARSIERVPVDAGDRARLMVTLLTAALEHVRTTQRPQPGTRIAGVPATERDLRVGAEQAYRRLAVLTDDRAERVRLVDAANAIRPWTWT